MNKFSKNGKINIKTGILITIKVQNIIMIILY